MPSEILEDATVASEEVPPFPVTYEDSSSRPSLSMRGVPEADPAAALLVEGQKEHQVCRNSLPTTLSNASALVTAALASRRTAAKDNPTLQMKWDQMYSRLLAFREREGHCLVPNRYKLDRSLGQWVSAQRRQYKQMRNGEDTPMTEERAKLLESVGFKWATLERGHVPWDVRYNELVEYAQNNGDCLVPIGYKENPQLSSWVSTQRQEMKLLRDGKPTRLTEERIRLLNEAGFVWESQRGKRGGRKKRKAADKDGLVGSRIGAGSDSRNAIVSPHLTQPGYIDRPSEQVSRIVSDTSSDSSLASTSGGVGVGAFHHPRGYYDVYAYGCTEEASFKKSCAGGVIESSDGGSFGYHRPSYLHHAMPVAVASMSMSTSSAHNNPEDSIFADADEDDCEDSNAAETYLQAQRRRPFAAMTANFTHMSARPGDPDNDGHRPSFSDIHPATSQPPPCLGERKVADSVEVVAAIGSAVHGCDKNKEEAAAALLSMA